VFLEVWNLLYYLYDPFKAYCLRDAPTSLTVLQFHLIQVTIRQHRRCIIPQAVTHSLVFLRMSEIIARNMLSWL